MGRFEYQTLTAAVVIAVGLFLIPVLPATGTLLQAVEHRIATFSVQGLR